MFTNRKNKALAKARFLWLGFACDSTSPEIAEELVSRLRPHQIVSQDLDILVTEVGFVTMALLTEHATDHAGSIVAPGIDHNGTRGYLVLAADTGPYHSLASCPEDALAEALSARQKAASLVEAYGGKQSLKSAVRQASLFQMATVEDFERSGLCLWGAESFLKRNCLLAVARRLGLPRFLLQMAGPYGERLIAASLLRTGHRIKSDLPRSLGQLTH